MKTTLYTLFQKNQELSYNETELLSKVFIKIQKEQSKSIKKQKIIWSASSFVFSIFTITTGWHAISSVASSDIGNYVSLMFSDTGSIMNFWKEFVISIIESLPIIGIGLFLLSIYLLFWSTKKYSIRSHTLAY